MESKDKEDDLSPPLPVVDSVRDGHGGTEFNSRRHRHPRALDDEELFVIEGSKSQLNAGTQLREEESEKCRKMRQKALHHRLKLQ